MVKEGCQPLGDQTYKEAHSPSSFPVLAQKMQQKQRMATEISHMTMNTNRGLRPGVWREECQKSV